MGKTKVLMVEHHAPGSLYTLELGRELKQYCDITVFCKTDVNICEEGMTWIPGFYGGGKGKIGALVSYEKTLLDLGRLIRRGHFEVLHIQSFKNARLEMDLYRKLRKYYGRLIMTVHNVVPHEPMPEDVALYRDFYHVCDLLIVHNETSARMLKEQFQIPDEKIAVIAHGAYQTYAVDASLRDSDPRTHFLLFGRIRPYKGVDILLKAVAALPPDARKKSLFVIRGKQYPQIDGTDYGALVKEYGIEDCVEFSSQRVEDEEIPALMGNTDIGVFPYRNIYGSGSLLMSYTYDVPVIASDIPAFQEETEGGVTGRLFRSEDSESLKEAILDVLTWDESRMSEYKKNIRRLVNEKYSWRVSAQKTADAYRAALAAPMADPQPPVPRPLDAGGRISQAEMHRILLDCADANYEKCFALGHALPGCNGPYHCQDTSVRNTGHWLITYIYLWKTTGQEKYKAIALKFARYLVEKQAKSASGAIECMSGNGADHLNGLIGQAWTIEALVYAYQAFGTEEYLDCAFRIYRSQRFDASSGFWARTEPDGTQLGFDFTVNHQVWFCIAGLLLLSCREDEEIRKQTNLHIRRLEKEYFGIHKSGLIRHFGAMKVPRPAFVKLYIKQYIKYLGLRMGIFDQKKFDICVQEEGYHLFELYGYAMMAQLKKDAFLFSKPAFKKALAYGLDMRALNEKLAISFPKAMNKYAYGYNAPGFELPLAEWAFTGQVDENRLGETLQWQVNLTYNPETHMFDRNTADPETLTARLYELVRYFDACRKE